MLTTDLCATSIMKTIHNKGKDFKEYKPSGSYQENSQRAGLTKEKVMRGEGTLLVYATTASYPCIKGGGQVIFVHVIIICERKSTFKGGAKKVIK